MDDNRAIHDDFRKILSPSHAGAVELAAAEAVIFGTESEPATATASFKSSPPTRARTRSSLSRNHCRKAVHAMAFMDVRMPPGLDGIETTVEIWKRYPDLQVVLCTAYSDYSWNDLLVKLGPTDRLVILKKPFDNIEVLQLAHSMTEKWRLLQQARAKMADMERMVTEHTAKLRHANERLQIEVAERKQAQTALEQSQQMILKQERLAVVGQLSAGVAHDFNNIMTVIHGHAGLLLLKDQVPALAHAPLREIEAAAMRAAKLTQQLLAFSRKQAMQPRHISLGEVVGNVVTMLCRAIGAHITLKFSRSPGLPAVHADAGMIEHALMNLAVNARDAMPDGGELIISVEAVDIGAEYVARNAEARGGRAVCLSMRDTGCGMDDNTLSHIFEPFFTTKDVGKGTGLGLATVYGIVRQHQGWIVAERAWRGNDLQVFSRRGRILKQTLDQTSRDRPSSGRTMRDRGSEPALRHLARRIIQRYGYSVIEAAPARSPRVWHREKQRIDLLLTDIVMPEESAARSCEGCLPIGSERSFHQRL